eukprot:4688127-Amphidinium_carterae.1
MGGIAVEECHEAELPAVAPQELWQSESETLQNPGFPVPPAEETLPQLSFLFGGRFSLEQQILPQCSPTAEGSERFRSCSRSASTSSSSSSTSSRSRS